MSDLLGDLSKLSEQGVVANIDLELCRFLLQEEEEVSDLVLLAGCLLSYLYRQGDVCLALDQYAGQPVFDEAEDIGNMTAPALDSWVKALSQSSSVGSPGDFKPLILDKANRLYLHKLWYYEDILARQLLERREKQTAEINMDILKDGINRLFEDGQDGVNWQKIAAVNAVKNRLSIISGGPGTGKTSTVVRIMALLLEQSEAFGDKISIALTAPTGKAAARLKDSILSAKNTLDVTDDIRKAIPDNAMTLHQLLGARQRTSAFRHNEENPVPYDVVIVDEASMVDQALMSKLLQALLKDTRLILLGDKDQLASVEAGAVLGDICGISENGFSKEGVDWLKHLNINIPGSCLRAAPQPLLDNITLLTKSYRFGAQSGIGQLATSINRGDVEEALDVLESPEFEDANLVGIENQLAFEELLSGHITDYFQQIKQSNSVNEATEIYDNFRILSAHRRGPWGVEKLNRLLERLLREQHFIPKYEQWYPGKPIIINTNNYILNLYNGDTGICLADEQDELKIYFRDENHIRCVAPARLPDHSMAYALTVHKSQGSEFDNVLLILPDAPSKILTRELLYTAITRARTSITILGRESVLRDGLSKKMERTSGLRERFWNK